MTLMMPFQIGSANQNDNELFMTEVARGLQKANKIKEMYAANVEGLRSEILLL